MFHLQYPYANIQKFSMPTNYVIAFKKAFQRTILGKPKEGFYDVIGET